MSDLLQATLADLAAIQGQLEALADRLSDESDGPTAAALAGWLASVRRRLVQRAERGAAE